MNRKQLILLLAGLALIGGTAGLLARVRSSQKLAAPGVTTTPTSDPKRLKVELPEQVLDYTSEWLDVEHYTLSTLPADTSFGHRRYEAPDGFVIDLNVVMMGADRTSLHKPQYCLEGQGWNIDSSGTLETSLRIERPISYDLPVARLIANKVLSLDGQDQPMRGVYTYWFVAEDAFSASVSGFDRMWMMGSKLLRTGVLQRWAYVSCFSVCRAGQEEAVFERMKKFICAAAPEFQRVPQGAAAGGPDGH
jgi:hypothetical protein